MNASDRRYLPLVLNAVGMAVVVYAFFAARFEQRGGWFVVGFVLALIAWATAEALSASATELLGVRLRGIDGRAARGVQLAAIYLGVVVTSLSQAPTLGIHTAPLAIILILAISDDRRSIWVGATAAALSFVLTPIGFLLTGVNATTALSFLAGNAVWVLIGISRRQARAASRRGRELAEQQARASALAARQTAARDIHDVLAHSLGGLVIQLDAAEALLESGRLADGQAKVAQARALAADGLADARRAVSALRAPDDSAVVERTPSDLAGAAERLLRAHRELGGRVEARIALVDAPQPLPPAVATAFERALQESLSNARRHAPGEPVAVELKTRAGRLELTVSNALATGTPRSAAGGGHGLTGMAERFAQLPGGAASAGERDGEFVVSASARVRED